MGADHFPEIPKIAVDTLPSSGDDLTGLPTLAVTSPAMASEIALSVLSGRSTAHDRSLALHALAIVARDRGRISEALSLARAALGPSRRAGPAREAAVRATYGTTLVFDGRTEAGLAQLDRAVALARDQKMPGVLHLRGCTYWLLGRYSEALVDLTSALDVSRRSGDRLWEGRSYGSRADVLRALGETQRSAADYLRAEQILTDLGEDLEATLAVRNRAQVAFQEGDVVSALGLIERTEERYRAVGLDPVEQLVEHASVLLVARLAAEARQFVEDVLQCQELATVWRGDLLVTSARAALIDGDWPAAQASAEEAERLFRAQHRDRWAARAGLLALEAAYAGLTEDDASRTVTEETALLQRRVNAAIRRLRLLSDPSLTEALMLAAQIARDLGQTERSIRAFEEAAAGRRTGTPLAQAAGWLAAATLAEMTGNRRALRHACRRGLDAVDEHRRIIGDLELRSLATGYGLDLVVMAISDAVATRDARAVVWWTERWRATSLSSASSPPDDPELRRDIAALRDVSRRLGDSATDPVLHHERDRLESAVRRRYRRLVKTGVDDPRPELPALLRQLTDVVVLYLVMVKGVLHSLVIVDGEVRFAARTQHTDAVREQSYSRFTLRRAAYGRSIDLRPAGERLQQALIGDTQLPIVDRPVLVVPPASLLTVPFGLMPALRETTVAVTPSLSLWQRARRGPSDADDGHVALVVGPELTSDQQEVVAAAGWHDGPMVLTGSDATVERTLDVLTGARLGHLAAHGTFRADAPRFSSLRMADGPLMVHDLDRLAAPAQSVILSACDSGGVHPLGADEALGLVTALLAMGTRAVLASVVPVNDAATVTVMGVVHEVVARGGTLAEGLREARRRHESDTRVAATALSFNVWGT